MLRRRWLAIWVHSNSLIKNLTPFADDEEIRLLNFLMEANSQKILLSRWLHSKLISMYFEVFKQLKDHVLIYFTGAT